MIVHNNGRVFRYRFKTITEYINNYIIRNHLNNMRTIMYYYRLL